MAGAGLPDTETRDEVLARLTAEHGPEVAKVILRDWERNVKGTKPRGARRRDSRSNWYADRGNNAQRGTGVRGRDR